MKNRRKIIFVVGIPGSGKSYFLDSITDKNCLILDDICKIEDGIKKVLDSTFPIIYISDPFLCIKKNQEKALITFKDFDIEWIFFENDLDKCLKNVKFRKENGDDRKVENFARQLNKEYHIRKKSVVKEVYERTK